MSEKHIHETAGVKAKLESGSEHARKALEVTAEAAKNVGQSVKKEAQEAFATGKEYLGKAAQSFGEAATETYDVFCGQANEKAQAYRTRAELALHEASDKVRDIQNDAQDYIRSHPLKSVGIALGIGFLLATIFRR